MKAGYLALFAGCFFRISAAIVFPPGGVVNNNSCTLPNTLPGQVTVTLGSTAGAIPVFAVVEKGSFLLDKLYSVTAVPGGADLDFNVNAQAKFSRGHNKTYVAFFTGTSTNFAGFVTIDVNCVPQSTITLKTETVDQTLAGNGGPTDILLKSEIKGANPGDVPGFANPIKFTMTPDTGVAPSPWIVSASVPGSSPNTGTVTANGAQDLTVSLNPTGLPVQSDPYLGFVHIRDSNTGFGSADLTIRLAVTSSGTGNVTLPHVAVNGPYVTGFYVMNTAATPASYSMSFLDDNGQPFSVPVPGQAPASLINGFLGGNGSTYIEVGDANAQPAGGSVRVTADSSIAVQALFRLHLVDSQGTHYYEAAVPASAGSKEFVIPFDATKFAPTNEQIFTGIAIANTEAAVSNVTCVARDSAGTLIPNAVNVPQLKANGHWAGFDFPALLGKRGTIDCSANTTITAMALHSFERGAISSLPVLLK